MKILHYLSDKIRHIFHVASTIRPLVWICLYIILVPIFALIYYWLPDSQFRIPDGAGADYGSWLYYSIVTITTLGFGDYTPAHGWAQAVTAIEVMCGLIFLGFFLNAVGSLKSENDVESAIEKQRRLHQAQETDKLRKNTPIILHHINTFLAYCYAVTTPAAQRKKDGGVYNADFNLRDMVDLYEPTGLSFDLSQRSAVEGLLQSASRLSLYLDSIQNRIDVSLWPELLENCFTFVADEQMFASTDVIAERLTSLLDDGKLTSLKDAEKNISTAIKDDYEQILSAHSGYMGAINELYLFIKKEAATALSIESALTKIAA